MTSIFGGTERLRVRRMEQCKTCSGSGVKPGAKVRQCTTCNGQGATVRIQRTPLGAIQNVQPCPTCRGTGQEIEEYCGSCRGKGTTVEVREVDVRVPAGVDVGTTLRVRDAGNSGRKGNRRGDLYVQIKIRDDPRFKREGTTIYTEEEVAYTDAILGTVMQIDTVDGRTEIRIPAGTQPNQKLRIRGKGAPQLGNSEARGDQIITMKVRIPTSLSDKERDLIQQLASLQKK